MWEGYENDRGDPEGASTFRDFYFATVELIFL